MARKYETHEKHKDSETPVKDDSKFLKLANKRLKVSVDAESHNREAALDDLRFINGDMWDQKEKARRSLKGRPALMVNQLNKYHNQLIGEQRQNRPRVKVRPIDSKADVHIAKIREGIMSNIDYLSNASIIYDQAYASAVDCGYGAWRILTRYTEENPFLQEIYKELIPNPFSVFMDPRAKDPTGADAEYGFILTKYEREEFAEEYPKATAPTDMNTKSMGISQEMWWDKDTVTVAEYFVKEYKKKRKALLSDGSVMDYDQAEKMVATSKTAAANNPGAAPLLIMKDREIEECQVKQYIITANEILEEHDVVGRFIPIVVLYGRERNIEGKRYIKGIVRDAKDPQRMFNYWYTSMAETIALAPKAPWMGTAKQFKGYEKDYATANMDNIPFLKYNHDPQAGAAMPMRQAPPSPSAAHFSAVADARQNIKDSIGMYSSDVGDIQPGRDLSGAALARLQAPGDIGTFDLFDNLVRAIQHDGRIMNDMIPYIYDTERDARLRNIDDTETFVPINTNAQNALNMLASNPTKYQGIDKNQLLTQMNEKGRGAKYNDITVGKYDVAITTGKTFATQRMEAADNFIRLLQTPLAEPIAKVAPDLVIKNLDFLEADELAARLKKLLPPGIAKQQPGEPPQQPLPPSPPMQLQMMKIQTELAKQQKEQMQLRVALIKLYKESKETDTDIKKTILETLMNLEAPPGQHPADVAERGQMGGQAPQGMPQGMPQAQPAAMGGQTR